jgi:hypothetical protein
LQVKLLCRIMTNKLPEQIRAHLLCIFKLQTIDSTDIKYLDRINRIYRIK